MSNEINYRYLKSEINYRYLKRGMIKQKGINNTKI